jgi:hypothetical protein
MEIARERPGKGKQGREKLRNWRYGQLLEGMNQRTSDGFWTPRKRPLIRSNRAYERNLRSLRESTFPLPSSQ